MTLNSVFHPPSFAGFLEVYPFVCREDHACIEAMMDSVNTAGALACIVRSCDDGDPGIAGVVHRLAPHLGALRLQAHQDPAALARLHRLTRTAGALVKAIITANGGEGAAGYAPLPAELRTFAQTAAVFRWPQNDSFRAENG